MKKIVFLLIAVTLFCEIGFAEIDFNAPTSVKGIKARVLIEGQGNISGELEGGTVKISVLTFRDESRTTIHSLSEKLKINEKEIEAVHETDEVGNKYAVFEVRETGEFEFFIDAIVETNIEITGLRDYNLINGITLNEEYLKPSESVQSNHAEIRTIALNKFQSSSLLETVGQVTEWTNNFLEYDWAYYPGTYSALETLENRAGVCDEFATLSAAMLRASGIPTRFVHGIVYSGQKWGQHAWLEFYSPENGWLEIDSTYGEAGFVDGTHIGMGIATDPKNAIELRAEYPETAALSIEKNEPKISIDYFNSFSNEIEIKAGEKEAVAMNWESLEIELKNNTNSYMFVPLQATMHPDFKILEEQRTLLFKPGETRIEKFSFSCQKQFEKGQIATYQYKIVSLLPTITSKIIVYPEKEIGKDGKLSVESITPLVKGKDLIIEIVIENMGLKKKEVTLSIKNGIKEEETYSIEGLQRKTIQYRVSNYSSKEYTITIEGEEIFEEKIIQPKETKKDEEKQEKKELEENKVLIEEEDETTLLLAGSAGLALALVLLILLRKKL